MPRFCAKSWRRDPARNYVQKAGSNATPVQSDELFSATMCLMSYALTYNFGATATIEIDLKLADGSGVPTFGSI